MRTQLVLIQATSFCNIACDYCYLPNRSKLRRIELETLEQIYRRLFASPFLEDEVLFLWHAGEPLTLPIRFYEQALALQRECNVRNLKILNAMQTNGTLITEKWCRFFREENVHVGVSLDGPRQMHDAYRVDRTRKGTFDRTMQGIELLERNNIAYTVISVITNASVREPDLFWHFFSGLKHVSLGLNPEEIEGVNASSSLQIDQDARLYQHFIKRLLELNDEQDAGGGSFHVREIDKLTRLLNVPDPAVYTQTNVPMAIVSFDCDGNFSTFSPELLSMTDKQYGDFLFGNVFTDDLGDIYQNPTFQRVHQDIQRGIQNCQEQCAYFGVCGGGSPSNKLYETGSFSATETMACRLQIKAPTNAVLEHLEQKYYLTTEPPVAQSD